MKDDQNKNHIPFAAYATIVVTLLTIIWGGGAAYQRLVALESWKSQIQGTIYTQEQSERDKAIAESQRELLRKDIKGEVNSLRLFNRSLCFAVSNLQRNDNLPVTNDCDRP